MTNNSLQLLVGILLSSLALSTANAQTSDSAGPALAADGIQREGFIIGLSVGPGAMQLSDGSGSAGFEGTAFDLHLGGMLNPRTALMFDSFGVSSKVGHLDLTHVVSTIAVQYWPTSRSWVKGGIGMGTLGLAEPVMGGARDGVNGGALLAALGYELNHGRAFTIDAQLRLTVARYDAGNTVTGQSFSIGVNWY